ncbi:MAG: hypothetical protein H6732_02405 [Alphaproteobacteria bacterium]|nr:hypothetical protein [Alphaproteobacteria bacterium]
MSTLLLVTLAALALLLLGAWAWRRREPPHGPRIRSADDIHPDVAVQMLRSMMADSLREAGVDPDGWVPFGGDPALTRAAVDGFLRRQQGEHIPGGDLLADLARRPEVPPLEAAILMDLIATAAVDANAGPAGPAHALTWVDVGLGRKPDHTSLLATRAGLLVVGGRPEEGVPFLASFLETAPDAQRAYTAGLLALGLHELGRADEATHLWEEAERAARGHASRHARSALLALIAGWRRRAQAP